MTRPATKPSADQRRAVERARELAEAAATVQTLAAYLEASTQHPGRFFYVAYSVAVDRLRDLLVSLDQAGTGQADPGGNPSHAYIPTGPVEAAPYEGYCPPEVRQEAFAAVLGGVELGAYDCRTSRGWPSGTTSRAGHASLMWRCRLAGREEGRKEDLTDKQSARRADRIRPLADPLLGAHPFRRPS